MKMRILAAALLICGIAHAQNPYIALLGAAEAADGIAVSEPRTILAVDVVVERENIICGPYARYAQKYLGLRAPLTNKTTWTVVGASVALLGDAAYLNAGTPAATASRTMSYTDADDDFARLQADKTDMNVPALEDAAKIAADQIFSLRRHRIELVTGEAGENVFGAGLKAALDEITRLEQSYLELFLGKRILTTETRRCPVCLQSGKKQYIVSRFTADAGLLPENDLSGDMILLQVEPSGNTTSIAEASAKETSFVMCRVADPSTCTVTCNSREYARAVVPVFEFGRTIKVAVARRK